MTTVFFFGAGASYGSGDCQPSCPPLSKDLFDALCDFHNVFKSVPHDITCSFRQNFEVGMRAYIEHNKGNVMEFQRELGRYFLQYEPRRNNLYVRLLGLLRNKNILFSTTNYDLLLELAGAHCGLNCTHYGLPQPKTRNTLNLLKIHGSCNFWPDIGTNKITNCTFAGNGTDIEAPIKCVPPDEAKRLCLTENSMSPAIALFTDGKQVKVCPSFVKQQLVDWQNAVSDAKCLIIVGARPNYADAHIWEYIGRTLAEVYFTGQTAEVDSLRAYRKSFRSKASTYHMGQCFDEAMPHILRQMCV